MGAGEFEFSMDYYEDDKRFRREEYEGNFLEVGLELERDEDVIISFIVGLWGGRSRGSCGLFLGGGVGYLFLV